MQTVCQLAEVPDRGARAFTVGDRSLLVVRLGGDSARVFINRCPHLGIPLQWQPDRYLDDEGVFIRCATHGALFEKDSGLCVQGPCRGESLWLIDCRIEGGEVLVDPLELPPARTSG